LFFHFYFSSYIYMQSGKTAELPDRIERKFQINLHRKESAFDLSFQKTDF